MDSIHGGSGHEGMTLHERQYQLFASSGAIKFPIEPVTEAWKEKVCFVNRNLLTTMKLDKHANLNSSSSPVFADQEAFSFAYHERIRDGCTIQLRS